MTASEICTIPTFTMFYIFMLELTPPLLPSVESLNESTGLIFLCELPL